MAEDGQTVERYQLSHPSSAWDNSFIFNDIFLCYTYLILSGLRLQKTCLRGFANTHKGTDQPALPRSLISAFIILLLASIISKFATSEISII